MSSTKVTIIGSLNYDLVTFTNKVPEGGETYQANSIEYHIGGKGLNEALAASRLTDNTLNIKVRMIGNIGDDSFGKELKQSLINSCVDTSYIKTLNGISSGVAVILVEPTGENRILIIAGANGALKPTNDDYELYFPKESSSDKHFVILQNEYPDTIKSINWIKSNRPNINIAYNPSPFKSELIDLNTWSKIDLLIVNEGEALDAALNLLSKEEYNAFKQAINKDKINGFGELAKKLQLLINQTNISTVIITMGSLGSIFTSNKVKPTFHKAKKVDKVIDTTGAGDTFFGGIISRLACDSTIKEAVQFATVASSLAIQKKGAAESIPTIEKVKEYLQIQEN